MGTGPAADAARELTQAVVAFGEHAHALTEATGTIPRSITEAFTHTANINLNGAGILDQPAPSIKEAVGESKAVLNRAFTEHLPDAGVRVE